MAYEFKTYTANKNNYGSIRNTADIQFIVVHYTGNDGDTDENNGKYFRNNIVEASAHYFVDDDSVTQSVPDNYIAWSVGGRKYPNCYTTGGGKYYGKCTNVNSISIELCDDVRNGVVYPSAKTIENAIALTKSLMKKYNIPASNVIRHFDVTGKSCPAYWCGSESKKNKWLAEFHNKLTAKTTTTKKKTETKEDFKSYKVEVTAKVLNVRNGAGTKYKINTTVKKGEVYTIVKEKKNGTTKWGKLKSGAGWISLAYTKKIK